jgi:hypothetical protein
LASVSCRSSSRSLFRADLPIDLCDVIGHFV